MPSSLNSLWIYLQYHFTNNDMLQQYSLYAQKTPWITKKNIIKTVCILQYKIGKRNTDQTLPAGCVAPVGKTSRKNHLAIPLYTCIFSSGKSRYHFISLKDQTHRKRYFSCVRLIGSNNGCGTFCVRQFIVFHHSLRFPKSHTSAVQWLESGYDDFHCYWGI